MAAFVTTIAEKKELINTPMNTTVGGVYVRTFTFTIPANTGATDTCAVPASSFVLPAGTVVLSCTTKANTTNTNSTQIALKATTSTAVFAAATAWVADTWVTQAVTTPLAAVVDDTITVTLSVGAAPATATTVQVSLVLAAIGSPAVAYTTYTN